MDIGLSIFATDYAIRIDELAREAGGARFRVSLGPRAHSHSHQPHHAFPQAEETYPSSTGTATIPSFR